VTIKNFLVYVPMLKQTNMLLPRRGPSQEGIR
jgi:hypothetical protein